MATRLTPLLPSPSTTTARPRIDSGGQLAKLGSVRHHQWPLFVMKLTGDQDVTAIKGDVTGMKASLI